MTFALWYLLMGALLVLIALISSLVKQLPFTTTMLYLGVGVLLGPMVFKVINIDPFAEAELLERLTELAVIVSLFTAGLKLRVPLDQPRWKVPLRLALTSMVLTVVMVAVAGAWGLGLPIGAAVLLGAVLAPTDPVLASEVQLESAEDRDRLRFSITGEAGLNDGTAFPFVMLGLGLLGLHELGSGGWRWLAVDVAWAVTGGLGIGAIIGSVVGHLILYLRHWHRERVGLDEFIALGLIGASYGTALLAHTYGFLAVFASGLALHAVERRHSRNTMKPAEPIDDDVATPVLGFNERVERLLEVALVLLLGGMLSSRSLDPRHLWFVPVLLLLIRPAAVWAGLVRSPTDTQHRWMISWFGIRGIGSLYYLMFAIGQGVPENVADTLISVTLWTVAASVVIHGISVTPLMRKYQAGGRRDR